MQEALPFFEEHSHPRLWRSLGKACLEQQAMDLAEHAFVACQDFSVHAGPSPILNLAECWKSIVAF
jgi:hypothetical protein